MKISTKLLLSMFVPALMALLVIVALFFSYQDMRRTQENGKTVRQIRSSITELNHIVFAYIIYHEERPKQQFMEEHDVLTKLIAGTQFQNPDQQRLLDSIRESTVAIKNDFSQLVSNDDLTAGTSELNGTNDRLVSLLLQKSYGADTNASLLGSHIDDDISANETRSIVLIFLVMVLATIPLTILLFRTRRGITSSLSTLNKGTAIIGSGNLDYRIEAEGEDEIGDLARSFNKMTSNLNNVTASKTDLEKEIDRRKGIEGELQVSNEQLQEKARNLEEEIDDRKKAEETLRETRDYLDNLFNYANAPIIVWNPDFEITRFNQAFEHLTGRTAHEVMGKKLDILFPDNSRQESMDFIRKTPIGERWDVVEIPILHRDGTVRVVLWNSATVYSSDGKTPVATIAQGQDITERKRAEESLKRYTSDLEIANKELEAFNYSVSHDLRQPLRALESFSQLLIEEYQEKLDETGQDYLNRVIKASRRMSELTTDMLKLSRVIRVDMQMAQVNLSEIAQSVVDELKTNQAQRPATIKIADGIIVKGDKSLLTIALTNLIENAWKFTSKCQQTHIEIGETRRDGESVYFVRDNGIGFDMKYQDKLFQAFQRLHSDKDYAGTGIGLAIVGRAIRRHGGKIWAESGKDKGTTFYFTLGG